ncbi:MAG: AMP-binding protein, partial [Alphaproteobacteria bacterium]|nr:AMP-binding protein [Alphaproteobacteria bacterium]
EKYRPTIIGGVPTSLAALTAVPLDGADISSIRYAITGGSPLPSETARAFEDLSGVAIYQLFGMTESTGIASVVPSAGKAVLGSAGIRLPYEQWRVAKIDADGIIGTDCGPDETGVLMISGPQVSPGYKDPNHNKGTFTDDGWLISGDLSRIDHDGYLFITGRSKDVIIRGAHNIDPAIIEEVIDQHPDVMLSAAVGMPDDYAGELPVAFVTLYPEAKSTAAEIMEFVAARISERPALPKEIIIIDDMPMTAVGKIFKPSLRWRITEKVFAARLDGVIDATVTVAEDRKLGTLATVMVKGGDGADRASITQAIADRVGNFTVAHEVKWL